MFEAQTKPLVDHYGKTGLLRIVNADAHVDKVFTDIKAAVGAAAVVPGPAC